MSMAKPQLTDFSQTFGLAAVKQQHTGVGRNMNKFKLSMLTLALAAAGSSSMALAQQENTQAQQAQEEAVEVIAVRGFRRSLQESQNIKMFNSSIVEAVSAEDIGKLPDVSIAESLARLPGLTAQRLNGRSQVISIRGLAPDFSTALLNGREQVSSGDNRGVEFDQYPSELLSGVVVYKTPDAGLIGQGLAGTADMRLVSPLAHGERTVAVNARYEWSQISALNAGADDNGKRFSISYIDQFADNTIGVALGFATISNPMQIERFEAWGYADTAEGNKVIGGAKLYANSNLLERDGFIGVFEYKPNDNFSSTVDLYYSKFDETQRTSFIELPLFWGGAPLVNPTVENGLVTSGGYTGVKGIVRNHGNFREADLFSVGWKTEFKLSDSWDATLDLSHSSLDRTDLILESDAGTGPAGSGALDNLSFAMGKRGPVFNSTLNYADPNLIRLTSPQGWGGDIIPGGQLGYYNSPSITDDLNQVRLSARTMLESENFDSLEVGLNYSNREKDKKADEFFLALPGGALSAPIPNIAGTTSLAAFGIPGMVSYDPRQLIDSGALVRVRNPNADVLIKDWNVAEDVVTGYVKLGINSRVGDIPVTGNVGTQIVHTDQSSYALAASGTGINVSSFRIDGGDKYWEVLPSLNLNFEVGTGKYVRVGLARTMARARMDQLRASQDYSFNPALNNAQARPEQNSPWSASGGNPTLRPWIANAVDVSYEQYFDDSKGYMAIAAFYKDLESYIYDQQVIQDFTGFPSGGEVPVINQGLATTPQNGKGGRINGLEFTLSASGAMIMPQLESFGAILTGSWTDSSIQSNPNDPATPLPGLSKRVANLTFYYENDGFSARVSSRYRSDFLGEISGFGNGRDLRMIEAETVVDAQISYSFSGRYEGLTLLLQANNLTDEPFVRVEGDDSRRVIEYQRYGRSYMAGLSYKF
ncbi:TonB-dependent receptor [Alishewanella jeotgali KCTC 22429]|uniref:TonB-dependent receptor n=2 Tax=Alishewanella jeotgali TaxID=545533 RepID=H3ZDZ7_9ALTE|nr:TonB-dependent receptor [Alishewanella jeotgali KCTC 22429]